MTLNFEQSLLLLYRTSPSAPRVRALTYAQNKHLHGCRRRLRYEYAVVVRRPCVFLRSPQHTSSIQAQPNTELYNSLLANAVSSFPTNISLP